MTRRAKATLVGMVAAVAFFPVIGVSSCPAGAECRGTFSTYWGLKMSGALGALAPVIAAVVAGPFAYWWMGRRRPDGE